VEWVPEQTSAWTGDDKTGLQKQQSQTLGFEGSATPPEDPGPQPPLPPLPVPPADQLPATFGDFDLLAEVARGGMGVVYKARQRSLGRVVALKMIRPDQLGSETAVRRFQHEAKAAAALDHPNIVPVYEIGHHGGLHYFTMAFVEGTTLKARLAHGKVLPAAEALALLLPVVDAVAAAHQHGIVHRDLKPENVLLDLQGRPRVSDFGLAKQVEGDINLTNPGQIVGTPAYMAPEQALGGDRPIGPAADVYALGCLLYCLLTGRPPFVGKSVTEVLCKIVSESPVPPRQLQATVPATLEAVCLRCLEKEPGKRFANAGDLAAALQTAGVAEGTFPLAAEGDASQVSTRRTAAQPGAQSLSLWEVTAGVVALVILAAAGVAYLMGFFSDDPAKSAGPGPRDTSPARTDAGATGKDTAREQDVAARTSKFILELPPATRRDFGLKAELIGGVPTPDHVVRFVEGQTVTFRVAVERDAYVTIWSLHGDGTIWQLFPSEYETDGWIKKDEPRLIPAKDARKAYSITATLSKGVEQIRVVASTSKPAFDPRGQAREGYLFYGPDDRKEWEHNLRGLVLKAKDGGQAVAVADAAIPFEVVAPELKQGK
jgi:tRNA A-37 threonylcarbamoyl transferase component Bud32